MLLFSQTTILVGPGPVCKHTLFNYFIKTFITYMNLIVCTLICLVFWEFHKMHILRPIKWNGLIRAIIVYWTNIFIQHFPIHTVMLQIRMAVLEPFCSPG